MTTALLTGSAGFVGAHMLERILEDTDWRVACPITLRHRGNTDRITPLLARRPDWQERVDVFLCDLSCPIPATTIDRIGAVDYILNIASESHVDRSIADPAGFVRNNVEVMLNVLEYARVVRPKKIIHMGTDEEYGPAHGEYRHREWDTIMPSNPYSASKAAQTSLATAWWRTYDLPIILTRTMNLLSPGQSGEKFVPTVIRKVLAGETVQIHSSPEGISGTRHWIDARDFADAWLYLLDKAEPRQHPTYRRPAMFHIVGEERSNLAVAETIARILGRPLKSELLSFHASRPGHDLRYALDGAKLASHGWEPRRSLDESLADIVAWYLANPSWLGDR